MKARLEDRQSSKGGICTCGENPALAFHADDCPALIPVLCEALRETVDLCNALREYAPTLSMDAEKQLRDSLALLGGSFDG